MDLPKQWRQDIRDFFKDPSGKEGVPFREIRLDPPMPWQDIHHEARAPTKKCIALAPKSNHASWVGITIHGVNSHHFKPCIKEGVEMDECSWTDVGEECPVTVNWLKSLPFYKQFGRIMFAWVHGKGWIQPHTDRSWEGLSGINYGVYNPEGCHMLMEPGKYVPWTNGSAFQLDLSFKHAVVNRGTEGRLHIICEGILDNDILNKYLYET